MKARLVRVAAKEAALLTPRRCMALAEVDRECDAPSVVERRAGK